MSEWQGPTIKRYLSFVLYDPHTGVIEQYGSGPALPRDGLAVGEVTQPYLQIHMSNYRVDIENLPPDGGPVTLIEIA